MSMLNIALAGAAHIHTPGFVKRLKARDDVQVTRVWDHQPARAQRWADELGCATASLEEIAGDAGISAVVVCSETNRHLDVIRPLAAARKHLFVEKPLGMGAQDARAMAGMIEQAGVLFQTGYFMRGQPAHLFLREQVRAGAFGRITRLRTSFCHSGSIGRWFDQEWRWMTDPAQAGVGAFGDLGTHALDIMLWLLGAVTTVTASVEVALGNYGACDEYGEGLLRFSTGALGSLAAGWVDVAHPVSLILSGTEGHAYIGPDGLHFMSQNVPGADGVAAWTQLPAAWPHAFENFLDAAAGKPHAALVTPREAAERSAVMEALYQGARTHAWVTPA